MVSDTAVNLRFAGNFVALNEYREQRFGFSLR